MCSCVLTPNRVLRCFNKLRCDEIVRRIGRRSRKSFSSTAASEGSTSEVAGKQRYFLLYHNLNERLIYPRIAVLVVAPSVLFCGAVSYQIYRTFDDEDEGEVSSKVDTTAYASQLYKSSFGRYMPGLMMAGAAVLSLVGYFYIGAVVKKLLLSADRRQLAIVTYRLIGKDRVVRCAVGEASVHNRALVKVGGRTRFYLSEGGTVTNERLFESAFRLSAK